MKSRNAQKLDDAKEELKLVNKAIAQILSGSQGYRIGSRSVQKADLSVLYQRKDKLEDLIGFLSGENSRTLRVVPIDR